MSILIFIVAFVVGVRMLLLLPLLVDVISVVLVAINCCCYVYYQTTHFSASFLLLPMSPTNFSFFLSSHIIFPSSVFLRFKSTNALLENRAYQTEAISAKRSKSVTYPVLGNGTFCVPKTSLKRNCCKLST